MVQSPPKKFSLIPLAIIGIVGAAWAGASLFPDRGDIGLPAFPDGAGTLGGILTGLFGSDGSARDTEKLGSVPASDYLRGTNCPTDQVWRGIDAGGSAICGNRAPILAIGKFSELTAGVQVMRAGTTSWIPANTTDTLQSGDIIKTAGGTATVRFLSDESILRLDASTLVQLDTGNLGGKTVAQAILQDGRLWGRVLTSTGVNIGGGGLIAGVRGTSVSVEKGTNSLTIVDSRVTGGGSVGELSSSNPTTAAGTTGIKPLSVLSRWNTSTDIPFANSSPLPGMSKSALLTQNPWIRENLKKDIIYLSSLGGSSIASEELAAITPQGSERDAICINYEGDKDGIWWNNTSGCVPKGTLAYADYTKSTTLELGYGGTLSTISVKNKCSPNGLDISPAGGDRGRVPGFGNDDCTVPIYAKCPDNQSVISATSKCTWENGIPVEGSPLVSKLLTLDHLRYIIPTLDTVYLPHGYVADCGIYNNNEQDPINPRINVGPYDGVYGGAELTLSCADSANKTPVGNVGTTSLTPGTNGVSITGASYLKYNLSDYTMLKGKTVTVELSDNITASSYQIKTLLSLDTSSYVQLNIDGTWRCSWGGTASNCTTSELQRSADGKTVTINIPNNASITYFVLGNKGQATFNRPIGVSIKRVTVTQR